MEGKRNTRKTKKRSVSGGGLSRNALQNAENYLYGRRDAAVLSLAHDLKIRDINEIIPYLKKDIRSYVNYHHKDFEGNIKLNGDFYELIKDFNTSDFFKREWKYQPYMLTQENFDRIQASIKNPIYVKRYNYRQPIYSFDNDVAFDDLKQKQEVSKEKINSDVQFYYSEKDNSICAKVVSLKHKPTSLRFVNQSAGDLNTESSKQIFFDQDFFDRSLSISMYVLLDGDPNKAMPYMRYDNDPFPHNNVWIGDDKRKKIFGEVAESPHFHFQTEDDSILCLRKLRNNEGVSKYLTGRCNAIDCPHLKLYLARLDKFTNKQIIYDCDSEISYGMPFLQFKKENKPLKIDVDKIFEDYLRPLPANNKRKLSELKSWCKKTKDQENYINSGDKVFGELIKALDFLSLLSKKFMASQNAFERNMISDIEILVANNVVDCINNNSVSYIAENNVPLYRIKYNFVRDEKKKAKKNINKSRFKFEDEYEL